MTDKPTPAERTKAYRERLKAAGRDRADMPGCLICGRKILLGQLDPESPRGKSRTGHVLCATCWRKSDEGLAAERAKGRKRRRAQGKPERKPAPSEAG